MSSDHSRGVRRVTRQIIPPAVLSPLLKPNKSPARKRAQLTKTLLATKGSCSFTFSACWAPVKRLSRQFTPPLLIRPTFDQHFARGVFTNAALVHAAFTTGAASGSLVRLFKRLLMSVLGTFRKCRSPAVNFRFRGESGPHKSHDRCGMPCYCLLAK
jgi:hypothetical protein